VASCLCVQAAGTYATADARYRGLYASVLTLDPATVQDFARNQVEALADSVLAIEPSDDGADADAADAGKQQQQQQHGGGLHMSDAGGLLNNKSDGLSRAMHVILL
jgi:hypothetical protein